ncbi:hypothetical protein PNK_2443 [Candidatus Protochlamydia naegleriophila]|uniref:Uncharacterized protein n=1 Tax=Candidatus Protochlamydia naegleriophila TaxID=389348 RepID=A0A0U5JJ82_9BACT|nr:hypothetical protein PNK_2443 [Candidatus Protochlamydia naegleriophila]
MQLENTGKYLHGVQGVGISNLLTQILFLQKLDRFS